MPRPAARGCVWPSDCAARGRRSPGLDTPVGRRCPIVRARSPATTCGHPRRPVIVRRHARMADMDAMHDSCTRQISSTESFRVPCPSVTSRRGYRLWRWPIRRGVTAAAFTTLMLTILSLAGVVSGSAAIGQRVRRRGGVGLGDDSGRGFGAGAGVALQGAHTGVAGAGHRGGLMGPVLGGVMRAECRSWWRPGRCGQVLGPAVGQASPQTRGVSNPGRVGSVMRWMVRGICRTRSCSQASSSARGDCS